MSSDPQSTSANARFAATRWSIVLAAGNWREGGQSRSAMESLARAYWFPLYAYIRRIGNPSHNAEDLIQGFFTHLLEKNALDSVDRNKGKFRSFLLASLKNYISDQRDHQNAQKRGGGQKLVELDSFEAEKRYTIEPVDSITPEKVFEQRWAWTIIDQVMEQLRKQYADRNQENLFDELKGSLTMGTETATRSELARQLGMDENALSVAAHRLRRRFRELLREEVSQTVATPELVDEELKYLLTCL